MTELPPSDVLAGQPVDGGIHDTPGQSSPVDHPWEEPARRSEEFASLVEEIRRWMGWDRSVLPTLADQIRRRLGLAPMSPAAAVLGAVVGFGVRLSVVVLATALVGDWAEVPWGRWAVIVGFYLLFDAGRPYIGPPTDVSPGPRVKRIMEDWTALLPTIVRESDLRDLLEYIQSWHRTLMSAGTGVVIAALMLTVGQWWTPDAIADLPAGSLVLLAWLLFDFGATVIYYGIGLVWATTSREARYEHSLFWPSPADSPEVKKAMQKITNQGSATGFWITVILILAVVLVGWESPLLVALGAGFVVIGYLALLGAAMSNRANIHKIVQRVRDDRLRGLQKRIDAFGPNYADLSPLESQEVRDLLFLHDKIRDAPSTPTTTRTVIHTAVGLIIPTILFLATVFGEVYAERFLDAVLP